MSQLIFFSRKHFTTILNCGATKSTSTFQEGRLGWTLTRPSYRLIGTHRLTRSVLEWRSVSSSSLLSSTIKPDPCIHWSQMVNTELGRDTWKKLIGSRASLQPNCNKEGFNAIGTDTNLSKLSLVTIKMFVTAATPGSGLAPEETLMTSTRVSTTL